MDDTFQLLAPLATTAPPSLRDLHIRQHRSVYRTRSSFDRVDSNCRLVVGGVGLLNQERRRQHD